MFPDSKIASKFQCGHTKAAALIHHQANERFNSVASAICNAPFSLSTDGSNDRIDKMYPAVIRYIGTDGLCHVALLSVPCVMEHSCSGENIFNTISSDLRDKNISWQNCIALGSDNAAVMGGKNKGVISFIRSVSPNCYFSGCPCHIIHLSSKYATEVLPIRISDALADIYYYLKMSAKRQGELSELQTKHLGNRDKLKVLKHVKVAFIASRRATTKWIAGTTAKIFLEGTKQQQKGQSIPSSKGLWILDISHKPSFLPLSGIQTTGVLQG